MTRKTIVESEIKFEYDLISYLGKIGGVKQWEYKGNIKTSDQLWANFKQILEKNNESRINRPLSESEFKQVKSHINRLDTPYKAGQFLYGVNGSSEIDIELDDGRRVYLTVFDQAKVGGRETYYQVVNQIERPRVVDGKPNRRFDVTLLINGLPIIQIELKNAGRSSREAINQMEQYIAERQFSDIFSTLQVLVAMTPTDIKYMANSKLEDFNRAFVFNWQDENTAQPIRSWQRFADLVLSIPMAHDLATRYMILDGTKNRESIKVMRPYQVYATRRVLEKVKKYDFRYGDGRLGYVWHTTGSGKTITSFKTAWLASRLPNVDKVIFLVDRIALTNQTSDAYMAYDPLAGFEGKTGVISDTANISDLHTKLVKKSDKNIIVTSIQKMSRYVVSDKFKGIKDKILFIVDEAHRSTGDVVRDEKTKKIGMLESIRRAIPTAAWVGYTGTPIFPRTTNIFGQVLHAYTIKEAISDKNVLGFNVEFKETIEPPSNPTEEDIDDNIRSSVYDTSPDHVRLVVKDILDNWKRRSVDKRYNALLTVHVGGIKPSIPRAMEYFDKFIEENKKRPDEEKIKVAISFSQDTSNSASMLETNQNLHRAIKEYNDTFNTAFDMNTVREYTDDLARRLNKTIDDGNYLDLAIVVDQLLTGFDAPQLNTLYVDRTLKGASLIQAYSRTNRVHDPINKPWGNIINYRWPEQNEYEMNRSLAIYSNRMSADEKKVLVDLRDDNIKDGLLSKKKDEILKDIKNLVSQLSDLTSGFNMIPRSEIQQEVLYESLQEYNKLLSQYKQITTDLESIDDEFIMRDQDDSFYYSTGIKPEEELRLTTYIAEDLRISRAKKEDIDISHVHLNMVHIHEVTINYDYLTELIAKMANEIHNDEFEEAKRTRKNIDIELAKSDNLKEKSDFRDFTEKIYTKEYIFPSYPVYGNLIYEGMEDSKNKSKKKIITLFIRRWGLDNTVIPKKLSELIDKHKYGKTDLDNTGELNDLMLAAKGDYKELADPDIAKLEWVRYRVKFRDAFYDLADEIKRGE
ncbi:MAG: HsdR family type I site-specific deoxyribonuclease [Tissierellia bacterium]|nr:HsdR family type I site-specific deoxyribonuclease [Tissierellia bacterium]